MSCNHRSGLPTATTLSALFVVAMGLMNAQVAYKITDLGTLGGSYSSGLGINASGQVTGSSRTAGSANHAFLWKGTSMADLGTLGGSTSAGLGINASGQVTGYSSTNLDLTHAFLWNGTSMVDLGTLGGATELWPRHQRLWAGDGF